MMKNTAFVFIEIKHVLESEKYEKLLSEKGLSADITKMDFDPKSMNRLKVLADRDDIKLIVISPWRIGLTSYIASPDEQIPYHNTPVAVTLMYTASFEYNEEVSKAFIANVKRNFKEYGIEYNGMPYHNRYYVGRGNDILLYMHKNPNTPYVVLSNTMYDIRNYIPQGKTIKVSASSGLTLRNINMALDRIAYQRQTIIKAEIPMLGFKNGYKQ